VLAGTYWGARRNNHSDLRSLLVANAVTGAASLFRRSLLDVALPFPPAQFAHVVSWLALNHGALDVFVHPNTGDQLRDHRDRAIWVGHAHVLDLRAVGG